jgi:TolB-like protein/class 3 adenylate cyclase/Tfp pilus assembly protein PilF
MPLAREQRRLAAIMAVDVVGYSHLMGRDESGTLTRLREHRKLRFEPALARHDGRLVKLTGDGALVEFASAVDALGAAIEFQQAMAEANVDQPADTALVFRMGLHVGDLIVDGDDLYGDGVNIAARLEAEAPPGGIVISRNVHDAAAGRLKATFDDLGSLALKNIERPIQAFRVGWNPSDWQVAEPATAAPSFGATPQPAGAPLTLPDKPSIAVLPFQNMSGDPEQEYFADGMVEDIITALSRSKALFVIARNSSFAYKGKSPDIRQVGHELGVRYVLEGSVRRAGNRVRITGQLIDSASGAHIWADRFEGLLEDIFELQDQVTSNVVAAISPALERAEIARARRKVGNLQAYDFYLRGLAAIYRYSMETSNEALALLQKAVELDPEFALGYATQAICYIGRRSMAWDVDRAQETVEAERVSRLALSLDRNDARVLAFAGHALRFLVGRFEEGLALLDQAVRTDPNNAYAWAWRGAAKNAIGDAELAIKDLERALRLSPIDTMIFLPQGQMAISHYLRGRYDEAASWAATALQSRPNHLTALRVLVASHAMAGGIDAARQACVAYQQSDPAARVSNVNDRLTLRRDEDIEKFKEGLRRAGLPE